MDAKIAALLDQYSVTAETRRFLNQTQKMFIDGEFVESSTGERSDVIDPATEARITDVPVGSAEDLDRAIAAARHAFEQGEWAQMVPAERERVLTKLSELVEENAQTLAEIEALDAGKALAGCLDIDVMGSADAIRFMAGWARNIEGSTKQVSLPGEHMVFTTKQPVGVVGAIVPWNWPLNMSIWKMAAPLAVGCTIVLKPAQITPLSMLYFAELCQQAGVPKGVVNIVTGKGSSLGNHLASHPGINKLSFTGSTEVGKLVGKAAIDNINHVTLELGGKSPMVAFDDCDIERVVAATQQSVFFNTGQVCSAGSRLYVQRGIYEQVIEAIAAAVREHKLGHGWDPETTMGPAISAGQRQSVLDYIEIGKQEGARVVVGGETPEGEGYFVPPTLFADCTNDMRIVQEEIFGPVLVVVPFDTEEEGIALANDNIYGLAASVYTKDLSRALRCQRQLDAGSVWVNTHDLLDANTPFGGFKQSGIGKDLGREQLDYFLETKMCWIEL